MAISSEMIIIGITLAFTYLVIYKKNLLFGNIGFISMGMATIAYSTNYTITAMGIIILFGSLINTIYDLTGR